MRIRCDRKVILMLAVLCVIPSSTLAQKYAPPFPRDGAERVQESERFVIWKVALEKGKSTGMHQLDLDQVSVTLTEGAIKVTRPDGTWSIEQERFGSVLFEPKGTVVAEEGLSGDPIRLTVFQLKDARSDPWPITEGVPGQFPRVGAVKLFETDRINVWDATWRPGERIARHLHYHAAAAVFLEGGQIHSISDEGVVDAPVSRKSGEVVNITSPRKAPHEEEEAEGTPRAIWVEFK